MAIVDVLPLMEVQQRLDEVVEDVADHGQRITITRPGKPAAVLISEAELSAIEETLQLLSDPDAMAQIRQSRAQEADATPISAEDVLRLGEQGD
jgi:antitoxin YefM